MHLITPRRHTPVLVAALVAAFLLLASQTWAAGPDDTGMTGALHPSLAPAAQGPASPSSVESNQIIVKYKAAERPRIAPAGLQQMQRLSQAAGVGLTYFREMSGNAHVLQLPDFYPAGQLRGLAARLAALPEVEYAEPDLPVFRTLVPADPLYGNQWDYFEPWGIDAPAAWDVTTGSSTVVVADIDTGITNHVEFSGRTVPGYDMISNATVANDGDARDADPSDPGDWITAADTRTRIFRGCQVSDSSWHGTHTAGTIGATGNNGIGVVGINWTSKILPVRVLGKCFGYTSDIEDGMRWAAGLAVTGIPANPNPAKVLSLSLGGSGGCTSDWQSAIDDVNAAGAVVVVAAGNENTNANTSSPGNCNGVITVAATDRTGNRAWYSNYGSVVEIAAPGGDASASSSNGVLSTLNTGTTVPVADTYAYYQGTSMATPHVTGVASLLFSLNPYLTPTQALQILQSTAKPFPAGGTCTTSNCGAGIVDAGAAVHAVPPAVTGFTPSSGFVGMVVSISGANFIPTTDVRFNGTSAIFSVVSATLISATVPVGTTTGPISVTIPAGTATSSSNFTLLSPPTITSFSPTRGSVGTTVTVTGTNFTGATSVQFNGTNAAYSVLSSTSISTTVPAGATTGPIRVTAPAGSATSASDFAVPAAPAINTEIRDAGENVVTSALVGASVHDHATITGAAGTPTGSATFALYGTTNCSGMSTSETVSLNSGAAASSATTVPTTGLSYRVSYAGDINYAPATGACEPLTATLVRGVALAPPSAAKSGDPGVVVTYTLTLTNTGNAPNTFTLASSGNAWTTVTSSSVGPLAAGVGANIVVSVTVPTSALAGASDTATITATSQGDETKMASSTLTTTANAVRNLTLAPLSAAQSGLGGATITYTLTLTNTGNIADFYTLSLGGTAFNTVVNPASVGPMNPGISALETVTVQIPPSASGGSSDTAVVTATSQASPSKSASSTLTTSVTVVRGAVLAPPSSYQADNPGLVVTYTLTLTNTGNVIDSYSLTVSNNAFSTNVTPSSVSSLGAGLSRPVTATVQIPANAGGGTSDTAIVTATSQGDASNKATSTLTTSVNTLHGVTIAPASASKTDDPGATVSFTVRVTNTGNIVDTFTLAATGNSWPTNVPASVGPLAAGAGAVVGVSVIIPTGAAPGTSDSATVTATSQGENSRSASAVVTTNTRRTPTVTTAIHDASHNVVTVMPIGTSVHDRAVVTGTGAAPTGTITFTVYANMSCSGSGSGAGTVALASGVAHPSNSAVVTSGGLSFKARYGGDGNYSAADSDCEMLTAVKSDTTLTLSSSANPSLLGQSVTFTAQVSNLVSITPIGTVTFTVDGVPFARSLSNGTATYSTSSLAAGTHAVAATYDGDSNLNGSADHLSQGVNNPMPVLTAISPSSALVGSGDVTLTVTGADFLDVSVVRWNGNVRATTFVSGTRLTATILASDLAAAGSGSVTVFNPAPGGGETDPRAFTIGQVTTIVTLTSSKNPSVDGDSITLTATVTTAGGSAGLRGLRAVRVAVPGGTVTFYDGANALATRSLDVYGVATYTTSALTPGTHTLLAAYSGDLGHAASTSPTVSQVVNSSSRLFLPFIRR